MDWFGDDSDGNKSGYETRDISHLSPLHGCAPMRGDLKRETTGNGENRQPVKVSMAEERCQVPVALHGKMWNYSSPPATGIETPMRRSETFTRNGQRIGGYREKIEDAQYCETLHVACGVEKRRTVQTNVRAGKRGQTVPQVSSCRPKG